MRRTATLTALLIGASILAPTGAANAAGETCRGEAATIVGTGGPVVGTDDRDVIVTGTSVKVSGGGGDDLICVTPLVNFNLFDIDAGPGNDLVDSTALPDSAEVTAILGDGADTFVGGIADERVAAGAAASVWVDVPSESERDIIDTGEGIDSVVSGGPGLANDDEVRTGGGDDTVMWSGVMGAQGFLDAGADSDLLIARASGPSFGIDLATQKLSRSGVVEASFASVERLRVDPEPDLGTVAIFGSQAADQVEVHAPAVVWVDLGGGNDSFTLPRTLGGSRIDLGAGTDEISVVSSEGSVDLDLARSTLAMDDSATAKVYGVEDASVSAKVATVTGTDRANNLYIVGCSATIDGGKGKDVIRHGNYDVELEQGYDCTSGRTTLRGGSGNDTIQGGLRADRIYGDGGNDTISTGPAASGKNKVWGGGGNDKIKGGGDNDVLNGGAGKDNISGSKGRDVAIGGPDRDTCKAEIEKSCER